jgi:hypothetical protein
MFMLASCVSRLPQSALRILRTAALAAAIMSAIAGAMAFAGTADASAAYISSNSGGANVRSCGNTGCGAVAYLGNGRGVSMYSYCDSQWALGNYWSPRWFHITSPVNGWVHSSLVADQQNVGLNCSGA